MNLKMFTDGAARGNPGEAGIGAILYDDKGTVLEEYCRYLGCATNNAAEYQALIAGLTIAKKHNPEFLEIYMDSELLVHQLSGKYRVKNEHLAAFHAVAKGLLSGFRKVRIAHVPREKNKEADRLANKAIDHKVVPADDAANKPSPGQLDLFFL